MRITCSSLILACLFFIACSSRNDAPATAPSTNLAAGQASGQLSIDDRSVKLSHAYARLIELDMFDETKNVFKVWLTDKPVDAKILLDEGSNDLLAMKQSGVY